jgi:hypothetical protein
MEPTQEPLAPMRSGKPQRSRDEIFKLRARFTITGILGMLALIGAAFYFRSVIPLLLMFVYLFILQRVTLWKHPDSRSGL